MIHPREGQVRWIEKTALSKRPARSVRHPMLTHEAFALRPLKALLRTHLVGSAAARLADARMKDAPHSLQRLARFKTGPKVHTERHEAGTLPSEGRVSS